jgi:hypothetical protein
MWRKIIARFWAWRLERDYQRALRRLAGCSHQRTIVVDVGVQADKCLDCWALRMDDGPFPGEWFANSARPPSARL